MRDLGSNNRWGSFTILNNILTVSRLAGGEEWAGQPQAQPGGLLEGAGGVCVKLHSGELCRGFLVVKRVLQEDRRQPNWEKLKI